MLMLKFLLSLVFILLSVAFFTLYERKILGYSHNRFGPNKVSFMGLLQPFSDALKLFSKEDFKQKELMYGIFSLSPFLGLFLVFLLWMFFVFWGLIVFSNYGFLFVLCLSSFSVYFLLFSGWSSNTKYSLLGSYRSSAQCVSYEVVMIMCFLFVVYVLYSLNLVVFFLGDWGVSFFLMSFIAFFCWVISCLAECNRSPFDFSEGESELVSGFNTEYGGGFFSFIFIGEYGSIIFLSFMTGLIYFSMGYFVLMSFMVSFFYLWVRCSYPRLRYDLLMMMAWSGLVIFLLSPFFCLLFMF